MQITPTALAGVYIIEPRVFNDARGYFFECYNRRLYAENGIDAEFVQDNESRSEYGVVRGLHYQAGNAAQAKLLRVVSGKVLDVAVDLRQSSPSFGQSVAVELSSENKRQLFIPRGLAHGFAVLSPEAVFTYKCDNYYTPAAERGIAYDDPQLAIAWQIPADRIILSPKDAVHPRFAAAEKFA